MIITDTSFWVALINEEDDLHIQAQAALKRADRAFITTWPVIAETCYLLLKQMGNDTQTKFVHKIATRKIEVFELQVTHSLRITQLMQQYSDQPMELADASLVVLAEHLGHGQILTGDQRDFSTYRWKNRKPFENLMFPTA